MKPGNSVEEKTLTISYLRPGYLDSVIEIGEAVNERWQ